MVVAILLMAIAFLLGFFFWLDLSVKRTVNRELQTLASLQCPSCHSQYGIEAAQTARQAYLAHCEEQRKQRPELLINFARRWEVSCPHCNVQMHFHYETGDLRKYTA